MKGTEENREVEMRSEVGREFGLGDVESLEEVERLSIVEKYMLMLLYAAGGKVRGKLWLHKEMFALRGLQRLGGRAGLRGLQLRPVQRSA